MKLVLSILGLLFFLQFSVLGQSSFTSSELSNFVEIYMAQKDMKNNSGQSLDSLLKLHKVSRDEYKYLFRNSLSKDLKNITSNENALLNAIKSLNAKFKVNHNQKIKNLCATYSLSFATFNDILKSYKSDIKFQRSLKPYFDKYRQG